MNVQVYLHYLTNGDIQAGARETHGDNTPLALNHWPSKVLACIDVYLSKSAPKQVESIHRVVDEAFARIGAPLEARFYCEDTSLGRFEFLYRSPYPKDAGEAKAVLEKVLNLVGNHPFGAKSLEPAIA